MSEMPRVARFDDASFPSAIALTAARRDLVVSADRAFDRPELDIVVTDAASRAEHGRLPAAEGTTTWQFSGLSTAVAYDVFLAPRNRAASRSWLLRTRAEPSSAARDASTSARRLATNCKLTGQLGELQLDFAPQQAPAAAALRRVDDPEWRRTEHAEEMPDGTSQIRFADLGDGDYVIELIGAESSHGSAATEFPVTVSGTTRVRTPL